MTLRSAWCATKRAVHRVMAWFGPVASSVYGRINGEEAKRIAAKVAVTAVGASAGWAGLAHAARDPEVITAGVGFIAVLIGAILEGIHRYHEGQKPPDNPAPVPLPARDL